MQKDRRTGIAHGPGEGNVDMSCTCELADELAEEIEEAVKQSVARFLTANRRNIQLSSKEKIARASYGGGMIDMAMLVRHALGRWALEQLLIELESWIEEEDDDEEPFVHPGVSYSDKGEISPEYVRDTVEPNGTWVSEEKRTKKQLGDPMFA